MWDTCPLAMESPGVPSPEDLLEGMLVLSHLGSVDGCPVMPEET